MGMAWLSSYTVTATNAEKPQTNFKLHTVAVAAVCLQAFGAPPLKLSSAAAITLGCALVCVYAKRMNSIRHFSY
eukprot:1383211-Amphidinium_carterae.1